MKDDDVDFSELPKYQQYIIRSAMKLFSEPCDKARTYFREHHGGEVIGGGYRVVDMFYCDDFISTRSVVFTADGLTIYIGG